MAKSKMSGLIAKGGFLSVTTMARGSTKAGESDPIDFTATSIHAIPFPHTSRTNMHQLSLMTIPKTPATSFPAGRSGLIQRKSDQAPACSLTSAEAPPIVNEVLRSPGQPLDPASRAFMEPRFGHSFADVQVHPGAKAADSADAVNAHAYTVGRHVVFGPGQYTPRSPAGQRLLAHELAHVVQQSGNNGQILQRQPKEPSESAKTPVTTPTKSNKCPPFPAPGFNAIITRVNKTDSGKSSNQSVFNAGSGELNVHTGETFNLSWSSDAIQEAGEKGFDHTAQFFGGLHWIQLDGAGTLNAGAANGLGTWTAPILPGDISLVVRTVAQNCDFAAVKIHVTFDPEQVKPAGPIGPLGTSGSHPSPVAPPKPEPAPPPFNWNTTSNIIAEARDKHATAWDAFVDVYAQRNAPGHSTYKTDPCLDPNLAAADHYLFARTLVMDFGYPAIFVKSFNSLYESFKNDLLSAGIDPSLGRCHTSEATSEQEWAGEVGADSGSLIGHPENWKYKPFGRKNNTGTLF
jgi:hypothetical protein